MNTWVDGNAIIEGKTIREWAMSDNGLIDYEKCVFKHNVSNNDEYVIYDLGEYEYDPEVVQTTYCNGVDLARVAGSIRYNEPYKGMRYTTALNGDDYVRIFMNSFKGATIEDFVVYFFHLTEGDIYISETNHHVFVKGKNPTESVWKKAVDTLYQKRVHR